jgi:photosystem II stability/assembly factor-like uncharacterized protein
MRTSDWKATLRNTALRAGTMLILLLTALPFFAQNSEFSLQPIATNLKELTGFPPDDVPTGTFSGMQFVDNHVGFVLASGDALRTTDGGKTWKDEGHLSSCSFFLSADLWMTVVNDGTAFAMTRNAGLSWEKWELPRTMSHCEQMTFVDGDVGWMLGMRSELSRTVDGGKTWTTLPADSNAIRSFVFVNRTRGFAVTRKGKVLATSNGGAVWEEKRLEQGVEKVRFLNEDTGVVWASTSRLIPHTRSSISTPIIFVTVDGGRNWKKATVPIIRTKSAESADLLDVVFAAPNSWWIVGWPAVVLHSTDQGSSWSLVSHAQPPAPVLNWGAVTDGGRIIVLSQAGDLFEIVRNTDKTEHATAK